MNNHLPAISAHQDLDSGEWQLYATSHGKTEPAGDRLFRAPPYPAIRFSQPEEKQARLDAAILQGYIDRTWAKNVSKQKLRKQGENL